MKEIYHVYNRGVEKRTIFQNDSDRIRFVHGLYEFNDKNSVVNNTYYFNKNMEVGEVNSQDKEPIISLLAFCMMPNHFHLFLQPLVEGGISKFMQKFSTGYTMYFNKKYDRVGSLFQGTYKSVRVVRDAHFIHLPYYIHANPLDLKFPDWKKGGIENYGEAMRFLEQYRWSSFLDYIGQKNFPSVTNRDLLLDFFGSASEYKKEMARWFKDVNTVGIEHLLLE